MSLHTFIHYHRRQLLTSEGVLSLLIPRSLSRWRNSHPLYKAALPEGVRWITIHPNGNKDAKGVPVMIKESASEPGAYYVVGGAEGKMNHRKLTGVKSKEEHEEQAKERAKEKRAKKKEEDKQLAAEGKLDAKRAHDEALEQASREKQSDMLRNYVAMQVQALGLDPAEYTFQPDPETMQAAELEPGSAPYKMAEYHFLKRMSSQIKQIIRDRDTKLGASAEERAKAGMDAFALTKPDRTIDVAAAAKEERNKDAQISTINAQIADARANGEDEEADQLERRLVGVEEERQAIRDVLDRNMAPTIDEIENNRPSMGKGYNGQTKQQAIQSMVENGALDAEKLTAESANDKRGKSLINRVIAIATNPEEPGVMPDAGQLCVNDMKRRAQLLADAAKDVEAGNLDAAYSKQKQAEVLASKWEERVSKAENRDPGSRMGPDEYMQLVADKVIEGRKGAQKVSMLAASGATKPPEELAAVQADHEQLRQLKINEKMFQAQMAQLAKQKESAKAEGASSGYVVDAEAIRNKFNVADLDNVDVEDRVDAELKYIQMAAINNSLLNEVEQSTELMSQLDISRVELERAMRQHISAGAYVGLGNASMLATGDILMDRRAIDTLGVAGAAEVMALRLKSTLDSDEYESLVAGLESYHSEQGTHEAAEALEAANSAYAAAKRIELEALDDPASVVSMKYANDERRAVLESAMHNLGKTIGKLRGQAELLHALKGAKPVSEKSATALTLPMGETAIESIVQQMAAMGLNREEYHIGYDNDSKTRSLSLAGSAIPKIARTDMTQDEIDEAAEIQAIKLGHHDEAGWLPAGIARRTKDSLNNEGAEPPAPKAYAIPPDFWGKSGDDLTSHVEDFIGSRVADGAAVEDVVADMLSESFAVNNLEPMNGGQRDELIAAVSKIAPAINGQHSTETVTKIKGERADLGRRLAESWRQKQGLPLDMLHTQTIDPESDKTREALHRALTANPAAVASFTPVHELGRRDKEGLRKYFWSQLSAEGREVSTASKKQEESQKQESKQPESAGMMSMDLGMDTAPPPDPRLSKKYAPDDTIDLDVGGRKYTVNARDWQRDQQEWLSGGSRDMYGSETGDSGAMGQKGDVEYAARHAWDRYVMAHGGNVDMALRSVQEHMRGQFLENFHGTYSRMTGQALRANREKLSMPDAHNLGVLSHDDFHEQRRAAVGQDQRDMANVGRGGGGKFTTGSRVEAAENIQRLQRENQRSLIQDDERGAVSEKAARRFTLGDRVEGQVAGLVDEVKHRFNPAGDSVNLIPASMGDHDEKLKRFYKQQRGIRLIRKKKKIGLWLGAGSGKTLTSLGAFTDLNHSGEVRRAIYAVPSVVQKQFGVEALRYLDSSHKRPDGRRGYDWFNGSDKAERHAAYRNQATDFVVVTHQSLTSDTLDAVAEHRGIDREAVTDWFNELPRKERAQAVKDAYNHMGWHGIDMCYVDEAHYLSNRQGKANSAMANVIDAIGDNVKYHILGSGTPVKNDASEAFDYLSKLDPDRFADRDSFMRQYGQNTDTHREALQRLTARYFYQDKVGSGVTQNRRKPKLKLTDKQRQDYDGVMDSYNRLRLERMEAKRQSRPVDPEIMISSMRTLSPNSFAGLPESEHHAKAESLLSAYGTMRDAALNRVVNGGKFEDNTKMLHIADLADDYRKKGKAGVVFARNLSTVHELQRGLTERGHRVAVLTGAMGADEKDAARRAFAPDVAAADQDKHATADIIIMSDAGNTGLNLQRGKWLVHVNTSDTSPVRDQREARIDRTGQTDDVDLHELMTDTPFDGGAQRRITKKQKTSYIFQDPSDTLDDTGLAAHVNEAYNKRTNQASMRARAIGRNNRVERRASVEAAGTAKKEGQRQRTMARKRKQGYDGPSKPTFSGAESSKQAIQSLVDTYHAHVPKDVWDSLEIHQSVGKRGNMSDSEWQNHLNEIASDMHDYITEMH